MAVRNLCLDVAGVEMLEAMDGGASGMLTAATQLNDAINSGSMSMSYESVQSLLTYTKNLQTAVAAALANQANLAQTPKLGATPAADTYSSYLPTVATDQVQGLVPVLKKLHDQLDQSVTNLQSSLNAVQQTDLNNQNTMVQIHGTVRAV